MHQETSAAPDANSHKDEGFLDLGPEVERYPYQGIQQFWSIWEEMALKRRQNGARDEQDSEWVLFTGVEEGTFARDFLNSHDEIPSESWRSFDRKQHLLLAQMVVPEEHEVAGSHFTWHLMTALEPMGMRTKLLSGSKACRFGNEGARRPDEQYRPIKVPRGWTKDWPTVVLEVAVSETPRKLMGDVKYWLRQADGAVQAVLTMRANRRNSSITIEKWTRGHDKEPSREQFVSISKDNDNVVVDGVPLIIEFERLFLHTPDSPREKDIKLDRDKLVDIAKAIWKSQGFEVEADE